MVYAVTVLNKKNFNISPILNIYLSYGYYCDCKYPLFLKNQLFDTVTPYKSLWLFFEVFQKTPDPILLIKDIVL